MTTPCPFRNYIQNNLVLCRYNKPCDYQEGDKFLWLCKREYDLKDLGIGGMDKERFNAISKLEKNL